MNYLIIFILTVNHCEHYHLLIKIFMRTAATIMRWLEQERENIIFTHFKVQFITDPESEY
jgi:hypothetical protein